MLKLNLVTQANRYNTVRHTVPWEQKTAAVFQIFKHAKTAPLKKTRRRHENKDVRACA